MCGLSPSTKVLLRLATLHSFFCPIRPPGATISSSDHGRPVTIASIAGVQRSDFVHTPNATKAAAGLVDDQSAGLRLIESDSRISLRQSVPPRPWRIPSG